MDISAKIIKRNKNTLLPKAIPKDYSLSFLENIFINGLFYSYYYQDKQSRYLYMLSRMLTCSKSGYVLETTITSILIKKKTYPTTHCQNMTK